LNYTTRPPQILGGVSEFDNASDRFDAHREVAGLGVWFPEAKFNTLRAAAELVEQHAGCARMRGIMPMESTDRIGRAILVVDTNIIAESS
jgi:hypothetical protein